MAVTQEAISQDQLDSVCVALREGSSVRGYIDKNECGFSRSTLYAWLEEWASEVQQDQYARALARSADADVDDIRHESENIIDAAKSRVKIDALKWTASKKKPREYGDRLHQEITGKDGKDLHPQTVTPELAKAIADQLKDEF